MSSIVAFTEAKAKLSELLDRVGEGEEFIITRHDEMIARLIPAKKASFEEVKQAVEQLKELRKGLRIATNEIIAWKNEGRP